MAVLDVAPDVVLAGPIPQPSDRASASTCEFAIETLPMDESDPKPDGGPVPIPDPKEPSAATVEFQIARRSIIAVPPPRQYPAPIPGPDSLDRLSIFESWTITLSILKFLPFDSPIPSPVRPKVDKDAFTIETDRQKSPKLTPIPGPKDPPSARSDPLSIEVNVTLESVHSIAA
jgi:hypothetical protein